MSDDGYDPTWINRLDQVTPRDIRKVVDEAIAWGADGDALERDLKEMIKRLGSIERLAEQWTRTNLRAKFRNQLSRRKGAPSTWGDPWPPDDPRLTPEPAGEPPGDDDAKAS